MSLVVTATPAGSPSRIATSAGPCDSPAVNHRNMPAILPCRCPHPTVATTGAAHGTVPGSETRGPCASRLSYGVTVTGLVVQTATLLSPARMPTQVSLKTLYIM